MPNFGTLKKHVHSPKSNRQSRASASHSDDKYTQTLCHPAEPTGIHHFGLRRARRRSLSLHQGVFTFKQRIDLGYFC